MTSSNEPVLPKHKDEFQDKLTLAVSKFGLTPSAEMSANLFDFARFLAEYNAHTNLMSPNAEKKMVEEHIADSLSLIKHIDIKQADGNKSEGTQLIDVGSGAGFPGMIVAFALPELKVTLVESIEKKCNFLRLCINQFGLQNRVTVLNQRAEELSRKNAFREKFSYATARAVGNFSLIAELTLPFLHIGGHVLAQRSELQAQAERQAYSTISRQLGGKLDEIINLPADMSDRKLCVIVIKKVDHTPEKFPREFADIQRKPLQ